MSLPKTITYCLDILKIKQDTEIYRNAIELAQRVPIGSVNGDNDNVDNQWIIAMKIIIATSKLDLSYVIRFITMQ